MLKFCLTIIAAISALLASTAQASVGIEQLQNRTGGMAYYHEGANLKEKWGQLHAVDSITYPSSTTIQQLLEPYLNTALEEQVLPAKFDHDYASLASKVQESWRLFHAGQYKDAYYLADSLGLAGLLPKLRSLAINHHYFVTSKKDKQETFAALIREIEHAQIELNLESASIYLLKAFAIGRYGQEISPVSAFAKGLGGKLKRNIYKAATLEPDNTEAMMFKAVFDSEAINHAGSITSKLLYGASKKRALSYFEKAMRAAPQNTALLLEYGKACLYICPRKERSQGYKTLEELSNSPVLDVGDLENMKMAEDIINQQLAKKKPQATVGDDSGSSNKA